MGILGGLGSPSLAFNTDAAIDDFSDLEWLSCIKENGLHSLYAQLLEIL